MRLNQLAPESAQKNINLEDLYPLSTPAPSLREQMAIADALDGGDDLIDQDKTRRERLQLLKAATADALLTGRVRLRV